MATEKPHRMSGGGGHPLTATVTSMWGAVEEADSAAGTKPLTFMIYFRGTAGWHERKWDTQMQWFADPYVCQFSSDLTTLRAEVDRGSRVISLFGRHLDLAKGNVILVEDVDRPGHEEVTVLGHFDLTFPEDLVPAVWLLGEHESLKHQVLGQNGSPEPHGRNLLDIAAGKWGWDSDGVSCEDNPHEISFATDGKTMVMRYTSDPNGFVYDVIEEGHGFIRTRKVNEKETNADGQPVVWDLVILGPDSYCWHRTDWRPGGCTQPAERCEASKDR